MKMLEWPRREVAMEGTLRDHTLQVQGLSLPLGHRQLITGIIINSTEMMSCLRKCFSVPFNFFLFIIINKIYKIFLLQQFRPSF